MKGDGAEGVGEDWVVIICNLQEVYLVYFFLCDMVAALQMWKVLSCGSNSHEMLLWPSAAF